MWNEFHITEKWLRMSLQNYIIAMPQSINGCLIYCCYVFLGKGTGRVSRVVAAFCKYKFNFWQYISLIVASVV